MHEQLMHLHVLEIQLKNACIAALADKPSTVANPTCMVGLCTMKPAVCCLIMHTHPIVIKHFLVCSQGALDYSIVLSQEIYCSIRTFC